jgi:hypothetical protein
MSLARLWRELPYAVWRDYDTEDTIRFYGLRMHELGMIKSPPQKLIADQRKLRRREQPRSRLSDQQVDAKA